MQDLGDSPQASAAIRSGAGKWLLLSSPNAEKLHYLRSNPSMDLVVMPLWTLEELQNARETVYSKLDTYAGYSGEEVAARFKLFGGVPRYILERPRQGMGKAGAAEDELAKSLHEISSEDLLRIFKAGTYYGVPKVQTAGILFHVVEEDKRVKFRFASEEVCKKLVEEFQSRQKFTPDAFIETARAVPELGAFRGYALEQNAHRSLIKNLKVPICDLKDTRQKTGGTRRVVKWPGLTQVDCQERHSDSRYAEGENIVASGAYLCACACVRDRRERHRDCADEQDGQRRLHGQRFRKGGATGFVASGF